MSAKVHEFPWRNNVEYANGLGKRGARLSDFWEADMVRALEVAYKAARNNANKESEPFLLTTDELLFLMRRSLGRCEVSGIQFTSDNFTISRRRPFTPSIDRISAKEPYSLDNCRLVATIVNIAIGDWGEDVFWQMVKAAGKRGRYTELDNPSDQDSSERAAQQALAKLAGRHT